MTFSSVMLEGHNNWKKMTVWGIIVEKLFVPEIFVGQESKRIWERENERIIKKVSPNETTDSRTMNVTKLGAMEKSIETLEENESETTFEEMDATEKERGGGGSEGRDYFQSIHCRRLCGFFVCDWQFDYGLRLHSRLSKQKGKEKGRKGEKKSKKKGEEARKKMIIKKKRGVTGSRKLFV